MSCTPADEMLIWRWKQVCALERVLNEATGEAVIDTLPGCDTQVLAFMKVTGKMVVVMEKEQ